MNIPFFSHKKNLNNIYLGVFLKEEEGDLFVLSLENNKIKIKEQKRFVYSNSWENLNNDIDEGIYEYERYFGKEKIKTIFFLYSHFINEETNTIKQPYLNKIKEIIDNLDLEAIGYIECFEGAINLLQKKETDLLNAIFLEIDQTQLTAVFYKGGKLDYKISISRTDNIVDDLLEAIKNYPLKTVLPSRIIIYDSDNLEEVVEKLITYKFDQKYFVQAPKIDILRSQDIYQSLIETFENQLIEKEKIVQQEEKNNNNQFGFYIGEDVSEKKEILTEKKPFKFNLNIPKPNLNILFSFFKFKLNEKFLLILGLILVIGGLLIIETFFHKGQLIVYLPYKKIEKKLDKLIDYQEKKVNFDVQEVIEATGQNFIGNKAKGSVVIHNFDDKEKLFSKGTVIETSGLKFLLDSDIKVASSSLTTDGSAKLPGKANVSVTAQEIGENYNLAKNQRFTIENLPSTIFFAINENGFTGGSKKKIKTFSTSDKNNLEKKLLDKIKSEKKNPNLNKNQALISDLTSIKLLEKNFSKEIGEEAQTVELKAKAEVVFITYDKIKLTEDLKKDLIIELDKDYQISNDNLKTEVKKAELKNNQLNLSLKVLAKAVLNIDKDKLISEVLGKNKNILEKILKEKFQINGFNLIINTKTPLIKDYLPWLKNNLDLRFETQ